MKDILVICKKCGNKVPAASLKLDTQEKIMMCRNCTRNKQIHMEIEKEVFSKKQPDKVKYEKPLKTMHKCPSCNYSFRINPETKIPRNCPYCNKSIDFTYI